MEFQYILAELHILECSPSSKYIDLLHGKSVTKSDIRLLKCHGVISSGIILSFSLEHPLLSKIDKLAS